MSLDSVRSLHHLARGSYSNLLVSPYLYQRVQRPVTLGTTLLSFDHSSRRRDADISVVICGGNGRKYLAVTSVLKRHSFEPVVTDSQDHGKYSQPEYKRDLKLAMLDGADALGSLHPNDYVRAKQLVSNFPSLSGKHLALAEFVTESCDLFANYLALRFGEVLTPEEKASKSDEELLHVEVAGVPERLEEDNPLLRELVYCFDDKQLELFSRIENDGLMLGSHLIVKALPAYQRDLEHVRSSMIKRIGLSGLPHEDHEILKALALGDNCPSKNALDLLCVISRAYSRYIVSDPLTGYRESPVVLASANVCAPAEDVVLNIELDSGRLQVSIAPREYQTPHGVIDDNVIDDRYTSSLEDRMDREVEILGGVATVCPWGEGDCESATELVLSDVYS